MTRREFVAGATLLAGQLRARAHWDRSRISVITDEIAAAADDAATFARQSGLQLVEVRNLPGTNREYASARQAEIDASATRLAIEKIKVSMVDTSLLRFAWPGSPNADQARWDHRLDDLRKALRCAQIVGADKLLVFAGTRTAQPENMFQRIAGTLAELAAESEKQKVSLLLQNDPATDVATSADLAAVMKLVPSKSVGISWRPSPDGYSVLPKKRIWNVRAPAASLWPNRPESLNWRAILTALEKDGFAGQVTLEAPPAGNQGVDAARDALDQLVHIVREVS